MTELIRTELLEKFFDMVKINSESGEEQEFIDFLKELFVKELGADYIIDDYGNLILKIPPKNSICREPVLFGVHADTVKPGKSIEPVLEDGVIHSKKETILGADDKAGIAELFVAVKTAEQYPPLEIVVSVKEEVGLLGSKNIDPSLLKAKIGFVIDTSKFEDIIIGGPSYITIDAEIIGKGAHSGLRPEEGISSIKAAAYAISMLKEGWIDKETTVNVGIISGGQALNSVPERTNVKIECRSLANKKCIVQSNLIKEIFVTAAKAVGARAQVKIEQTMRAYQISAKNEVVRIAKKALIKEGLTPNIHSICSGTDASNYNNKGIKTIVMGMGSRASHSTEENISVEDMVKAVNILHNIFEELAF